MKTETTTALSESRKISKIVAAAPTSDGAGVKLFRALGNHDLSELDPFLLLDEFRSDQPDDYIAGFPSHPHRGFETVTYMLAGKMEHKDSKGNTGLLEAGGAQWMTAARGIIHSEMPRQENGLMWGFQLWINLPANEKMRDPNYRDLAADEIPEVCLANGTLIRVVAGDTHGVEGAVKGIATEPLFLDVRLPKGEAFQHSVPKGHNGFVYVYEGKAHFGVTATNQGASLVRGRLGVLGPGDSLSVSGGPKETRFLLLAGKPINEPIVRYGPFVMNSQTEIERAFRDYQSGNFAG